MNDASFFAALPFSMAQLGGPTILSQHRFNHPPAEAFIQESNRKVTT